jgi:hypothetical protein
MEVNMEYDFTAEPDIVMTRNDGSTINFYKSKTKEGAYRAFTSNPPFTDMKPLNPNKIGMKYLMSEPKKKHGK